MIICHRDTETQRNKNFLWVFVTPWLIFPLE